MSFSQLDRLYGDQTVHRCSVPGSPIFSYGSVSWDSLFVMARASTLLIATGTVGAFRDESSPLSTLYAPRVPASDVTVTQLWLECPERRVLFHRRLENEITVSLQAGCERIHMKTGFRYARE